MHSLGNVLKDARANACIRSFACTLTHESRFRLHIRLRVVNRYIAVVHGIPSPRTGGDGDSIISSSRHINSAAAGKSASTWYTTVAAGPFGGDASPAAVLRLRIASGRTHQIRVHAADVLRCPVVGDPLYGGSRRQQRQRSESASTAMRSLLDQLDGRQLLHAHRLGIAHPCSGQALWIEAPLPQCIREVWAALAPPAAEAADNNNNHRESFEGAPASPPRTG